MPSVSVHESGTATPTWCVSSKTAVKPVPVETSPSPTGAPDGVAVGVLVVSIPVSAFYAESPVTNVVRFCFVKEDATLDAALERMSRAREAFSR